VDASDPLDQLPLPRYEYSSLGQPHRIAVGPNSNVSAFRTTIVTTWRLVGKIEGEHIDIAVPVCDSQYVWVRQVQSIQVDPDQLPDWFWDIR
jgi:hypothetical protein